jgi:hypothetical protein
MRPNGEPAAVGGALSAPLSLFVINLGIAKAMCLEVLPDLLRADEVIE